MGVVDVKLPRDIFRNDAVEAKSLVDFLDKYYKQDRFRGRGKDYAEILIASHQKTLEEHGCDWISQHDSNTGKIVAYYPKSKTENNMLDLWGKAI